MSNDEENKPQFPTDLQGIVDLAQKLQGDVAQMQEKLAQLTAEGSAGGGMVVATVNGNYDLVSIKIEPDVVDKDEHEMLQDLVVAAVNQAIAKMRDTAKEQMSKVAGGVNIPGMPTNFQF